MTKRRCGGFWRRGVAFCIDGALLYLFSRFLLVGGGFSLELAGLAALGEARDGPWFFPVLYGAAVTAAGMVYFTGFHGAGGQTPGKMLLGLRVVALSGEAIGFGSAFLRWVGYLYSSFFCGLGFLWIAGDGRKQGWHDKLAATLVVRVTGEPPQCGKAGAPPGQPAPGLEKWLDKKEGIG